MFNKNDLREVLESKDIDISKIEEEGDNRFSVVVKGKKDGTEDIIETSILSEDQKEDLITKGVKYEKGQRNYYISVKPKIDFIGEDSARLTVVVD